MSQSTGAEWWRPAAARGSALLRPPVAGGQDSPAPFVALLIFIVLLLLAPQADVPGLGRVRIALPLGAFAIVAHCWTRLAARRPLMRHTRETRLVAAIVAWALITLPLSAWPPGSARMLFDDFLKTVGVFWLISNTVNTQGRLRTVAWVFTLLAIPLAVTGLWNFALGNLTPGGTSAGGRIAGFAAPMTADANKLAMVLNLLLPMTVAIFLISRRPVVRGALIGVLALETAAIVVTFSRGGFLTLAASFLLYLRPLKQWRQWRWAAVGLALVIAAVPLLPSGYLERLGTISNFNADETGAARERWELNKIGLGYVVRHPLVGAGLGMSFIADCERRGYSVEDCGQACFEGSVPICLYVHNVYLQYAMDLGWLGLGFFLALLASAHKSAARVRERAASLSASGDLAALAEAIRIMIVGFAVSALFYPWAYLVYFYLAAGLAVASGAIVEAEARADAPALNPAWT